MKYLSVILVLLLPNLSYGQKTAITEDGERVILKDDGTWELIKEESKPKSETDFRKASWGMSREQIKALENNLKITMEKEEYLGYQTQIAGLDCNLIYFFTNNKLVRGRYFFTEPHSNRNDYILDYTTLKKLLEKKYGEASEDEQIWKNDLYKDDYDQWGFAVCVGHLVYYAKWETDITIIYLSLNGENYEISLMIEYQSKQLKSLEEQEWKKDTLDEL